MDPEARAAVVAAAEAARRASQAAAHAAHAATELDTRLTNVERVVLSIQAQMTPRWLRMGAWGALIGAALKEILFK